MAKEATEGVAGAVEAVKSWPQTVRNYIEGLRVEMRRVTWPNQKQVRATTVVVIFTVFAFGAFFFVVDNILTVAMNRLFSYFTK
ncbi:MAG TPA: preprotein translocase subunit SecE [Bryobacterales bacterium]|nr:preprotein translocase subunit SecE [Bryobacterales bacterium]